MGEWDFARLQFQTDFGWILDRLSILLWAPGACYILVCCLSQLNYQKLENHKGQFRRGLTGLVWQKYSLVGYLSSQRKAWDSGNMMASCHGEPFLITGPVGGEYTSQNGEQCVLLMFLHNNWPINSRVPYVLRRHAAHVIKTWYILILKSTSPQTQYHL